MRVRVILVELVVLVLRVGDAILRKDSPPLLTILRELDALDGRVIVLHLEGDDGPVAVGPDGSVWAGGTFDGFPTATQAHIARFTP